MALLTDAGESYTLSGAAGVGLHNREDLSDFITNISPTETPFYTGIGRVKARAVVHDWLTHELAAFGATASIVVEGNEATLTAPTTLTRVTNSTQINQKSVAVSGTQDAVSKAGMGKELAYRVILHGKEIKRDLEAALLQNTEAITGNTTTARRLNGVAGFVSTNTTTITTSPDVDDVNGILEDCWDEGGNPDTMFVNGRTKSIISGIGPTTTSNYHFNHAADAKKFVPSVDVWDGDFGVQRIIPDRFDTTQTIKALEMQYWKLAELRPMQTVRLSKTGDTEKSMLLCECTLECRAETANGVLTHGGT